MITENYSPINPTNFAAAMRSHWEGALGNVSNPDLETLWQRFGTAVGATLLEVANNEDVKLRIFPAPTGTGKTQGMMLYLKMLWDNQDGSDFPGTIVVVRRKEEADNLAKDINALVGKNIALSHHSSNRQEALTLQETPILVICHASYRNEMLALWRHEEQGHTAEFAGFDKFLAWSGGSRPLIFIDEELAITTQAQASTFSGEDDDFYGTLDKASLFPPVWDTDVPCFNQVVMALKYKLAEEANPEVEIGTVQRLIMDNAEATSEDFDAIRERIRITKLQNIDKMEATSVVDEIELIWKSEYYTHRRGSSQSFHTASNLLSDKMRQAIVLDATAGVNQAYQLSDQVEVVDVSNLKPRNYANLTIKVIKGISTGKFAIQSNIAKHKAKAISLVGDKETLVITNKSLKSALLGHDGSVAVENWGAVDGRNDWRDYGRAVIYGLFQKPDYYYLNQIFAFKGDTEDKELFNKLVVSDLSISIIQGFQRIKCRKAVDATGNCEPCEVLITLPHDLHLYEGILNNITKETPGAKIIEIEETLEGVVEFIRPTQLGGPGKALVSYVGSLPPGRVMVSKIMKEIALTKGQKDQIVKKLHNYNSDIVLSLSKIGWEVVSERLAKSVKLYLQKP